jgi:NAD+ synthase (glutamine-hydrolysing)
MRRLRIGMAQINTTVGDFEGNAEKMREAVSQARLMGVDLLTFPELATCGYPPEDLLFKPRFIKENLRCMERMVKASPGLTVILGFVDHKQNDIYNAAAVIHDGKLAGVYHKIYLPNYGVFDEKRYFRAGVECPVFVIGGVNVGVNICEDMWFDTGPFTVQARSGAEVLIDISASPYHKGKRGWRELMVSKRARDNAAFVAYNNMVGGQDELVFDGGGVIVGPEGGLIARGEQFAEDMVLADVDVDAVAELRSRNKRWNRGPLTDEAKGWWTKVVTVSSEPSKAAKPPLPERAVKVRDLPAEVYDALVLGTRDYVRKNGFEKVLIGLSGGLDSSLVAAVAVDALGTQNVVGVTMPSRYSSEGSVTDSELLAQNLGIRFIQLPIERIFKDYLEYLAPLFEVTEPNVAEENLQARIRSNILMALSNKFGWLVLTTGNKSELATGYSTLYGDMAGGFAVIKDVPKTLVYELSRYRNSVSQSEIIPAAIIEKPPSAELRPDQKDTDSLPPYDLLDPIVMAYVEEDKSVEQIIALGFDEGVVQRAARLVDISEYKRRQAPPGIKITPRAFGKDRRLPITNRFKG